MGVRVMTQKAKVEANLQLVLTYIAEHEGCSKDELKEKFDLTKNEIAAILRRLKDDIRLVLVGSQINRKGTYYMDDGEREFKERKPTILGGRIVRAGELLRKKYGI